MTRRITGRSLAAALAPLPLLLGGCSADKPSATATTASSAASTSASSSTTPTARPSGFIPIPIDGAGPIPAGKVGMTANGRPDAPWAVYTVPSGWGTIGGWSISDEKPGGEAVVSYWTVDNVFGDPCDQSESAARMPVPQHAESLLHRLRLQGGSRVVNPAPVTVDGHRGVSVEIHAPLDLDAAVCPHYRLWEWSNAGERYLQEPGAYERLYLLDVDDQLVVLAISASADTPNAVVDRVARFVESVEFVPRS